MIIKILIIALAIILIYGLLILICSIDFNTNDADYLIVLGHQLKDNKQTNVLKYRLIGALNYCKKFDCKVILSGGITKDNTISEASVMKEYLVSNGIDSNRIILEDKSTDTIENIKNCKKYINSNKKIVVLSSNYHVLRSKMICSLLGLRVKGIGVYTPLIDLIKHLAIEEVYMFIHYFRIKRNDA